MSHQRGVALLLALWVLVLISLMLTGAQLLLKSNIAQAQWQDNDIASQLAGEAAVSLVSIDMAQPLLTRRWEGRGERASFRVGNVTVQTSVQSVRGLVDLNAASALTLQRLFGACRGSADLAQTLVARREQDPLLLNRQLLELPTVTPSLYRCVAPYITVWSGLEQPDPAFVPLPLRTVLSLSPPANARQDPGNVLRITSQTALPGGYHKTLSATVALVQAQGGNRPYRILDWQD